MSLLERYRRLSDLFDQVLSLSNMILFELERDGKDENLKSLLQRKDAAGRSIAELTQEIASSGAGADFQSNLRTLAEVKPILRQIEKQTSLLEAVEKRIQTLVKQRDKS
jgi:hypothetical protein